jgi:hypothetical protein
MAKIENTSGRRYEINWKGAMVVSVPRCAVDEITGKRTNGSAELADDVLDAILAGDEWARAVFASGDLVRVGAPVVAEAPAPAAEDAPSVSDDSQPSNRGKRR